MLKYQIDAKKLILTNVPKPSIDSDEVLIQVMAIGINRADLYQIQGTYPISTLEDNTPGLEVAGIIEAIGSDVSSVQIGERVIALLSYGGYSEYVKVNKDLVIKIPGQINYLEAASVAEVYATAYYNLKFIGQLKAKDKILISGGASGVGSASIQLGKLYNASVTALVSTEEKANYCTFLGANEVVIYQNDINLKGEYNIILDIYGGKFIPQYLNIAAEKAKIINIALLKNEPVNIKMAKLLFNNISLIGSTLRNQSTEVKKNLLQLIQKEILPLLVEKKLKYTIDSVFPYNEIEQALIYLEKGQHKGKIIIKL